MIPRNILLGGLAATASLAAQAQSSVTLYGLIDIAPAMVSRTNTADDRLFRLNSDTGSSSRFGVRGTEDLGGGLAAFFNLEAPLDAKNGSVPGGAASGACNAAAGCASATTPAFWRRNAYVGLRGGFGEVTFGRNYTAAIIKQAATLSATPSGINTGMATNLAAQGLSNDFWNSNQIRYDVSVRRSRLDLCGQIQFAAASGFHRCGSSSSILLAAWVGSLSSTSLR